MRKENSCDSTCYLFGLALHHESQCGFQDKIVWTISSAKFVSDAFPTKLFPTAIEYIAVYCSPALFIHSHSELVPSSKPQLITIFVAQMNL